jgi:hypothetical protein
MRLVWAHLATSPSARSGEATVVPDSSDVASVGASAAAQSLAGLKIGSQPLHPAVDNTAPTTESAANVRAEIMQEALRRAPGAINIASSSVLKSSLAANPIAMCNAGGDSIVVATGTLHQAVCT